MKREEIESKINEFLIEEIEIDEEDLEPDAHLKNDLGIDSLDFVDIVIIIDQYFGFKAKGEELAQLNTLSSFYNYIENKLEAN